MRNSALAFSLAIVLGVMLVEIGRAADEPSLAITAIDPSRALSGAKIMLAGRGFRGTKKVWFVVGQLKTKEAKFHVKSDTELEVEVPEYFTAEMEAAIIVETPTGVTVTMPRSGLRTVASAASGQGERFVVVEAGGTTKDGGSYVTLIEKEGIAASAGRVTLVAKGGRLDHVETHVDRSVNLIFAEPGALIADSARRNATALSTPHAYYSSIDKLFEYEPRSAKVSSPYESPSAPAPHIQAIKPNSGSFGDIVEIHGTGFTGTQSVKFMEGGPPQKALFQVKSDSVLRVEVPLLSVSTFDHPIVMVESPQGIAFTLARATQPVKTPNAEIHSSEPIAWIGKGGSFSSGKGGGIALIDEGGIVTHFGGGSSLCFVKNGGTLLDAASREVPGSIYCEPNAKISDSVSRGRGVVHVPKIDACLVDAYFNSTHSGIVPGPRR